MSCFLALRRRKRGNKTVTPKKDGREEGGETSSKASRDPPENMRHNEFDTEAGWARSFSGVRAKSANAILFTPPFCAAVTDQVTSQSETTEKPGDEAELDEGSQHRCEPERERVR